MELASLIFTGIGTLAGVIGVIIAVISLNKANNALHIVNQIQNSTHSEKTMEVGNRSYGAIGNNNNNNNTMG